MTTTTKAIRATIKLGGIELDVFQLPDGSYRYSKTDIEASLGYEPTRRAYRDFLKSKDAKALKAKELSGGNTTLKYMSKTYTLVTQEEVTLFWGFQAQNGNQEAFALIMSCVSEALERRADNAFGILRSEQERNAWFSQRMSSKLYRRAFTDKVADWYAARPHLKPQYGFTTLRIYKRAGLNERYKAWKNLDTPKLPFRDTLTEDELKKVVKVEDFIANVMEDKNLEVMEAIDWYKGYLAE
jgi:hypothetical protein